MLYCVIEHKIFKIGVWQISENEGDLARLLPLSDLTNPSVQATQHPVKRIEKLAVRACLRKIIALPNAYQITNGIDGAPNIIGLPNISVSFSHTKGLALAAFSASRRIGIDVEAVNTPRNHDAATVFMNQAELNDLYNNPNLFYYIWTAKEAAYKYIRPNAPLSFKKELRIQTYCRNPQSITPQSIALYSVHTQQTLIVNYYHWGNYLIAFIIEP